MGFSNLFFNAAEEEVNAEVMSLVYIYLQRGKNPQSKKINKNNQFNMYQRNTA